VFVRLPWVLTKSLFRLRLKRAAGHLGTRSAARWYNLDAEHQASFAEIASGGSELSTGLENKPTLNFSSCFDLQ
jgi:hypothetical protein